MEISKTIKRLTEILLLFSLFSFSASPILSLLGIQLPQQVTSVMDFIKLLSIFVAATLIVTILAMPALGYLVLTGWRSYKSIPKALRLCLAFTLGYVTFMLSGFISLFIRIPMLPTLISTIILWATFRSISGFIVPKENSKERNEYISVEMAADLAFSFLKKIEPEIEKRDLTEAKIKDGTWEVIAFSRRDKGRYKVIVDGSSGGIIAWTKE